jgi:hypothetical protein
MAVKHGPWRALFRTEELESTPASVDELFLRSFGHGIPRYPRHFVLWYENGGASPLPAAYIHQLPFHDVHLAGGMCVDASVYRRLDRDVFRAVRDAGGLATLIMTDTYAMLGDSPAVFGHVNEPRARQADYRAGMVDTDREHLMVYWRRDVSDAEKRRLIDLVASHGAF